jgi:hypothetical protein
MHIINIFKYNLKPSAISLSVFFSLFFGLFIASAIVVKIKALKPKLEKIIPEIKPFLFGKYFQQFYND